jgi:hypothetical protein
MSASRATFDNIFPTGLANQATPYHSHSSMLNSMPLADSPTSGSRKRWSLFRSLNVFGSTPNNRPGEVTPPGSPDENGNVGSNYVSDALGMTSSGKAPSRPATPPHFQSFSFKFSLETMDERVQSIHSRSRKLTRPQLPFNAGNILAKQKRKSSESGASKSSGDVEVDLRTKPGDIKPLKPSAHESATARYSGRALAEWAQVLGECRNFYIRRKQDGVPRDALVETPTMGVETFRMTG